MAAPGNAPAHRPLHITVHRDDDSGQKHGTFIGPPPKMRVDLKDYMKWDLTVVPRDDTAKFEINFLGPFWPFDGNPTTITEDTPELQAVNGGSYLYAVKVTTVGGVFTINHCPEADVGG
jgi:hypothetical protein